MPVLNVADIVKVKENIEDKLFKIFPSDTPFVTSLSKRTVKSNNPGWIEKTLAAPGAVNAVAEGADATVGTITQGTYRSNYTQILTRTVGVSGTSEAVDKYGRASELAEGLADAGVDLMQGLEYSCVGSKQAGQSTSPMQFASAQAQIDPSMKFMTGGASTPITEAALNSALLATSLSGGRPDTLMINTADALTVAGFAGASGRTRDFGDSKTLTNAINLYVGANGTVKVVQNRIMASGDSVVYNASNWKLLVLRPWQRKPLGVTGDSDKVLVVGEYSLQHNVQKASALIRKGT